MFEIEDIVGKEIQDVKYSLCDMIKNDKDKYIVTFTDGTKIRIESEKYSTIIILEEE